VAEQATGTATTTAASDGGRSPVRKAVVALVTVLFAQALFALCLVSALQLLVPRNMPFGVVGPSKVVAAVTSEVSLETHGYRSESAAREAIDQGKLYGAYVTGLTHDTLIVVPAQSFFGRIEIEGAFTAAAHVLSRPVTVETLKPLPSGDRVGAVVGLLLLPLLIGGYLAAVLVFKAAKGTAAAPWRALILTGYAVVGAVLTDLIAGPGLGVYANSHFWPLLPCFALITTAVVLAAAALQSLVGKLGTLLVAVVFIILGGAGAGGSGTYLLPVYWRNIGVLLPPQNAVHLIRNVLYFDGNDISTPLTVLFLYAFAGVAVIAFMGRIRPARAAAGARAEPTGPATPHEPGPKPSRQGRRGLPILVALAVCALMQCLFTVNYTSAGHSPAATDMPFGVTGPSPILTAAQKNVSLDVHRYPSEAAVKDAIDRARIWGALIPAPAPAAATLIVVPSISDLAPLDLALQFRNAAKTVHQPLTVRPYAPVKLAKKDPFGLVQSLMLVPLLIGGYMSATLLMAATGRAGGRWRAAGLAAFSVLAGLVVDLVVGLWLQGYPSSSFWIVWPICSLITAVVAFVAAVLQKLIGSAGTLLTVVVIILFGNPSSGGANGVPYLPAFWRDIGPYLPPRNAYILLHHTIYFHGHGITQALAVLLAYLGVTALALILLDQFRPEPRVDPEAAEAAAMTVPIGAAP
jgi:hypothetical protein